MFLYFKRTRYFFNFVTFKELITRSNYLFRLMLIRNFFFFIFVAEILVSVLFGVVLEPSKRDKHLLKISPRHPKVLYTVRVLAEFCKIYKQGREQY